MQSSPFMLIKKFSHTIIQVHLIQLLGFLFDADNHSWWTAVPSLWTFGMPLSSWTAAAAADRQAVARRESDVGWSRGL